MIDSKRKLNILIVSSECFPFAKSGGLGDVVGSLPQALKMHGVDVRVVIPKYRSIKPELIKNLEFIGSTDVTLGWRTQIASVYKLDSFVTTYFVKNDFYFEREGFYGYGDDFERFAFFSKACVQMLSTIDFRPDVIHCNDWQTGLVPVYLKDFFYNFTFYNGIKTLFTIHNLQYQGVFGLETLGNSDLNPGYASSEKLEFKGSASYMKGGIVYSEAISTVSKTYADEIQTPQYGYGMDGLLKSRSNRLFGITNGIDTNEFNPETDKLIYDNFSAENFENKIKNKLKLQELLGLPQRSEVPVFAIISRLVEQKGFDLIGGVMDDLMTKDVQVIILGTGDRKYEDMFRHFVSRYHGQNKISLNNCYDEMLAQRIYAGSDFFLMPSLFEPCGLGQIIAMRYGSIPIVRETGGLADTVKHFDWQSKSNGGNGFVFSDYLISGLSWAIDCALETFYKKGDWNTIVRNALMTDFSWDKSAMEYIELYTKIADDIF